MYIDYLIDKNIKKDIENVEKASEYEKINLSISSVLTKYRKKNNLNQKELANLAGISQNKLSDIEKGNAKITIKEIHDISWNLTKSSKMYVEILKRTLETIKSMN